ncbi:hypothetical protein E3N88_25881 [Mikania micrantha]|uniref:BZIP domain-containing protein n=1 Tax=Mikania micrantha TaxID=192012 RepID=A0A5N6N6Y1_9ASTR|nr:hypothetical protein E3N88_25881 [Mikania micrantha]
MHDRFWGWYPMTIREWIEGERVPPPRYPSDTSTGHRLPPLGVPMEWAFAAHVAYTRREARRNHELSDEVRVLCEKNQRLQRRNDSLQEEVETLHLQMAQLIGQHGQIVEIMQEHDGRIAVTEVSMEENHAMIQASDAMLIAWVEQFIVEPPPDDGPLFEVEDLEDGDFDEDPEEDPKEDEDDEAAESDVSHTTIDSD